MNNVFGINIETTRILKEKAAQKLASVNATFDDFPFVDPANFTHIGPGIGAVLIQYNTITNQRIVPAPFKRYRLFTDRLDVSLRYYQEPNTNADAYIPNNLSVADLLDPAKPIHITEGELKAFYMCTKGYPAIALPGVDMYKDKSNRLYPTLDALPVGKPVIIVFDSEVRYTLDADGQRIETPAYTNVKAAMRRLYAALNIRGYAVSYIELDSTHKTKIQVDDYLRENNTLPAKRDFDVEYDLAALQSEWFLCDGIPHNANTVKPLKYSNWCIQYGQHYHYDKPATAAFKSNKHTVKVNSLKLDPTTTKRFVADYYNMFRGWETRPVKGDITPIWEVWKAIFKEDTIAFNEYRETIAFLLQKPWIKQQRFLLMRGSAEGVGKSFLLELPIRLIGPHHAKLNTCGQLLEADFQDNILGAMYILMNEVADLGTRKVDSKLKAFTTDATLTVNRKGFSAVECTNYLLVAITTNQQNIGPIDELSRRALALPCIEKNSAHARELLELWARLKSEGFFDWYNSQSTKEALMYYFMNYDLGLYDGSQPPTVSAALLSIAEDNRSSTARYCQEYLDDVEAIIPSREYDLFRVAYNDSRTTRAQFIGELKHHKFVGIGDKLKHQVNLTNCPDIVAALGTNKPVVYTKEEICMKYNNKEVGQLLVNRYSRGKI